MSRILNLYGTSSDPRAIRGHAGMLCEFPSDSKWLQGAQDCYGPEEMLGSPDDALKVAHRVVSKLVAAVSDAEKLPILSIFEEPLLEQVSQAVQAFHLDCWIRSHGFSECRFHGYSPWLDRLQGARILSGSRYGLVADVPFRESSWVRRGMVDLWRSRRRPYEVLRRVAPLMSRYASAARTRSRVRQAHPGGIWFYSTSYNFTKIGLDYEPYFPEPVRFLVEDPATGGKCLTERGRDFYPLYAWARLSDIPSRSEVRSMGQGITAAVALAELSDEENRLCTILLQSDWWDHFQKRWLRFLIFHERVLQRWCDDIRPEMLVVGNAGWERAVLQYPRAENVPAVMLQHGVMHWVYAVADQPVTAFVLRGKFFQRCVNPELRRKTLICNFPQGNREIVDSANVRGDILFISTPYDVPVLFHPAELREIMFCLLQVASTFGRRLVIRVHPLERISFYQGLVQELEEASQVHSEVIYSQGPGIEDVLAHSCVAVLYFSTMFLDCLRHGIPIVSFGWHWFPNKQQYENEGIFNFARNLRHLQELVLEGISGQLHSRRDGLEEFLAPAKVEEISQVMTELWQSRRKAGQFSGESSFAASAD